MQKQSVWNGKNSADRIIIPVEIPENTEYWIYRIKLSNARIESEQTSLVSDVRQNVKSVQIAGFEVVKLSGIKSSLTRELLNSLSAPEKTKPFTNIYFIDSKAEAEKFQNFQKFKSDINNSIKNTHSRNGLIKFNKSQYVYLGLENDGYKDDIYVSLEVVALVENIRYFKIVER